MNAPRTALALSLALSLVHAPAWAAPDARYKAAVKLEVAGDVAGALAAFEAIPPAERDANVRLHLASCKRKLNRYRDAERDLVALANDPASDAATRDTAASDLDDLRAHFPKLVVRATPTSIGIVTTIDGAGVVLPIEAKVDPGTHVVAATRGGQPVYRREVRLADAESITIEVDAPPPAVGPAVTTKTVSAAPSTRSAVASDAPRSSRTGAYVAFGASALFLAGGLYALVPMGHQASLYRDSCGTPTDCDPSYADAAKRWQRLSWLGFGAAAISAGVGVYLFVSTGEEARVGVAPMGDRVGLSFSGSF